MRSFGIERLCVFGMPPVDFVELAAELECGFVGIGLKPMRQYNPHNYPDWSLQTDAALRRSMIAALRETGVGVGLCEGFGVRADADVSEYASDLDIAAELGVESVNVVSMDTDVGRTFDGFARLAEMADARGLKTVTEIGPGPISGMKAASAALAHVARPSFKLLLDSMHFFRLGGTVAEIEAAGVASIGYVQLCDAPRSKRFSSYMEEALYERMAPGAGELPLRDLLRILPADTPISLEVPQRSLAERGLGPRERVGACLQATRALMN